MPIELFERCVRERLAEDIAAFNAPDAKPLAFDRWVLASLLQKAIRRDEPQWALPAAKSLLQLDPATFWRRLLVTGFEDVSFGDLALVTDMLAGRSKRWRASIADQWCFASYFVGRMCAAPKCRAPNNLIEVGVRDGPSKARFEQLQGRPFEAVLRDAQSDGHSLPVRLLCALSLHGAWPHVTAHADADAERLVEALGAEGPPQALYALRQGIPATRLEHPIAMTLLWDALGTASEPVLKDDDFMPGGMVRGIPAYAFDMHTRSGAAAIRRYCSEAMELRRVLRGARLPPSTWFEVVRHCIFDLETGLVRRRVVDPLSIELRDHAETLGYGRTPTNAGQIMDAIRSSWTLYAELRSSFGEAS